MEALLGFFLVIIGVILLVSVALAPLKLYEISRQLNDVNQRLVTTNRLLAAIASATREGTEHMKGDQAQAAGNGVRNSETGF